jgi:hypothetical protein
MGERQIDGGLAAHRAGDDDGPLKAGGVEHGDRVGERRPAVLALVRALAEAAHVVRHAPVTRTEPRDDVLPAASVIDAGVDQQHAGPAKWGRCRRTLTERVQMSQTFKEHMSVSIPPALRPLLAA